MAAGNVAAVFHGPWAPPDVNCLHVYVRRISALLTPLGERAALERERDLLDLMKSVRMRGSRVARSAPGVCRYISGNGARVWNG